MNEQKKVRFKNFSEEVIEEEEQPVRWSTSRRNKPPRILSKRAKLLSQFSDDTSIYHWRKSSPNLMQRSSTWPVLDLPLCLKRGFAESPGKCISALLMEKDRRALKLDTGVHSDVSMQENVWNQTPPGNNESSPIDACISPPNSKHFGAAQNRLKKDVTNFPLKKPFSFLEGDLENNQNNWNISQEDKSPARKRLNVQIEMVLGCSILNANSLEISGTEEAQES